MWQVWLGFLKLNAMVAHLSVNVNQDFYVLWYSLLSCLILQYSEICLVVQQTRTKYEVSNSDADVPL